MKVPRGELHALPVTLPLDDVNALWHRRMDIERYEQAIKEAFETMHEDGATNGRLLTLYLHPWLIGQPFRIRYLDAALGHIMGAGGVWAASGSEIIDYYRRSGAAAR